MLSRTFRAALGASFMLFAADAIAQDMMGPAMTAETELGTILVGPNGMTLYLYTRDEPGVSNCYDQCAVNWPPFFVEDESMAGEGWSIVERTDGTKMWAYNDMPLYYWINDAAPGDTTGQGVGEVWYVVEVGDGM